MRTFYKTKSGASTVLYPDINKRPVDPSSLTDAELDFPFVNAPGGTIMEFLENEPAPNKAWIKVSAIGDGIAAEGWAFLEELEFSEPPVPVELDIWGFIKSCTLSARVINAEHQQTGFGINRDFMIATAIIESGKSQNKPQNIDSKVADTILIGPFQFSEPQWQNFIDSPLNTDGYSASDIRNPLSQAYGFGARALEATRDLSEALTTADGSDADGPYIPNSIELFLHHSLGKDAALACIKANRDGNESELLVATAKAADAALEDGVFQRYRRLFGSPDASKSIKQAFEKINLEFDAALKRAFSLVKEETPEDILFSTLTTLPWYAVAQEEMVKKVAEAPGDKVNDDVVKYFDATGFKTKKEDPWCGAFVAWCLKNCNSEKAAASVDTASAARAASWKSWGDVAVPIGAWDTVSIPQGAIVVLSPSEGTGTSGHVGFFEGKTSTHVRLLGGNQSDAVNISAYRRDKVVAIRMLQGFDAIPGSMHGPGTPTDGSVGGTFGPLDENDWGKYLEILGKRESNNNFRAINRFGYIGRWQFGALALIDANYVKRGASNSKLDQASWWLGRKKVSSRADWFDNKNDCQFDAMSTYTRRNYKSLLNIGALLPDEPKAVVVGMLAVSHLLGAGGAKKMREGDSPVDGNGVSGTDYFELLSNAFGGPKTPPSI